MGWRGHCFVAVLLALGVHLASVWAYPRLVMYKLVTGVPATSASERAYFPPATDHTQRRIVMPSPDLLYATCGYDLSHGALDVSADPRLPGYWSIAGYADNTDNFLVINDRRAAGQAVTLRLLPPGQPAPPADAARPGVVAPSMRGLLLMRVLVTQDVAAAALDAARRTLSCTVVPQLQSTDLQPRPKPG